MRALRLLVVSLFSLPCSGCLFARMAYFNTPTLNAPSYFDERVVRASSTPLPLANSTEEATFPLTPKERARYGSLDRLLEIEKTRAFLVIHDDQVVYERYFDGFTSATELPAFSMTKTYAAVLVGRAVSDGVLPSLDRSIVDYLPELARKPNYREITLDELLRMTSGIDFDEESLESPKFYYTTDLRSHMYDYDVKWRPGTRYLYGSVNVQLLWDVLHRRLGGDTISSYFEREIWGPLGAERPASWSLDSRESGVEKFFGGFNATLRDHARLGLLFLHQGVVGGKAILPESWIDRSLSPDPVAGWLHTADGWVKRGKYQWFLTSDGRGYFAKGYRGQYVFVEPAKHAVFVRFGEGYGDVDWTSLFRRFADTFIDAVTPSSAPNSPPV